MNRCQFGHRFHRSRRVETRLGPMVVWDWDHYCDLPGGYCTGRDDISRTLALYGCWEPVETEVVRRILRHGDRSRLVLDLGAHIGWYCLLAAREGYRVRAWEGDPENLRLLRANARILEVADRVQARAFWFGPDSPPLAVGEEVELVVVDLEGAEDHAVRALGSDLERVRRLLVEISPVFHGRYPALMDFLQQAGFRAWKIELEKGEIQLLPWDGCWNFSQVNFLFCRGEDAPEVFMA